MRLTRRLLRWWERKTGIDRLELAAYGLMAALWALIFAALLL